LLAGFKQYLAHAIGQKVDKSPMSWSKAGPITENLQEQVGRTAKYLWGQGAEIICASRLLTAQPHALRQLLQSNIGVHGMARRKKSIKRTPWNKSDDRTLKAHSKRKTPVVRISKEMKRTIGALRQRAFSLGVPLGHRR
jgi:hypothetical protein